ncbi:DNA topoisomerase IB [Frigidibacter albus]|uniref:DNA topoisomerase n=1 Tax=Frigidibacter albus TaxID=1465486 RepID=A0A6L8VIY2_9RHOB|nr:DNA topoisomerase IB [Frigidibacter albus]MZQ89646.1 DNA topoisomerase IB [Frigidibacter albus]NBE31552.1 DNA topoisomerase IB [Frigidibacter albus]GGH54890.1 DNA topoisomerase [Frigidibacter albus]
MSPRPTLIYYPDTEPGIRRLRRGRGFSYLAPDGTTISATAERARIAALAVPPAYEDVWICPRPDGHLQATGRDARLRKQYRYHPDWTAFQAEKKYAGLPAFGAALPRIRRAILRDLQGEAGDQAFAIAAVLLLIDRLSIRVGNPAYASLNGSFGATTLRRKHLKLSASGLSLDYTAKGGQRVRAAVADRTLNRVLTALDDLPGQSLAKWVDDDGTTRPVTSDQVNARLADLVGDAGATAKTFRTWNGSVAALEAALSEEKPTIRSLSQAAASRLHNTPTVARGSYIHPQVIDFSSHSLDKRAALAADLPPSQGLRLPERALLRLLDG